MQKRLIVRYIHESHGKHKENILWNGKMAGERRFP